MDALSVAKAFVGIVGVVLGLTVGLLLIAWRDRERVDLSDELAVLMTIFTGMVAGVVWKIAEFVVDWVRYSDIQKSNRETMIDFLAVDVGVVVGAVLSARVYCNQLRPEQRRALGDTAAWLFGGPSRFLERHGILAAVVFSVLAGYAVAGRWFAGRPVPGFPIS
jgi:hypothetical protein